MPTTNPAQEKMVPVEVLRDLTRGSFEHLALRIKDAISENREMFVGKTETELDSIATFQGHVVVGSTDGQYFRSRYEDKDGRIHLMIPERLDVPVVDRKNAKDFAREFAMSTVDAILNNKKDEASERILALVSLNESVEDEISGLAGAVSAHVQAERPWRKLYSEQKTGIADLLKDNIGTLRSQKLEKKYVPLYDGTIPEEKFDGYRESVISDLSLVADRLENAQHKAEMVYYPFAESLQNVTRTPEEDQVLRQFEDFADDYFDDITNLREHLIFGMKNEACVMCLGQVHDSLAEAMTDYEIAGSFIERMATRLRDAK